VGEDYKSSARSAAEQQIALARRICSTKLLSKRFGQTYGAIVVIA
jgi:hypothetical protein